MKSNISVLLLGAALLLPFGSPVVLAQNAMAKAVPAPIHPEAASALVLRVREQLAARKPSLKNWVIYYSPQYNLIQVEGREMVPMKPPVRFYGPLPHSFREEPMFAFPAFALRVQPLISPADYKRLTVENAAIDVELKQLAAQLKDIPITLYDFLPRNNEEKREVAAYNRLIKSWHYLPNFYFQNISLSWVDFEGQSLFPINDKSPAWKKEQAQVADIITALVSHYEVPQK